MTKTRPIILAIAYVALFLVSQWPLYAIDYVDITDWPNHLARFYVLEHLPESLTLQQYYVAAPFAFFPNLAMELVVPWLASFLGAALALKIFASFATLLLSTGAVALSRALSGRTTFLTLGVLIFANNALLGYGLFSYLAGLGVAMWMLFAWISADRWRATVPGVACFSAGAVLVYLCHLSAFGVYALCCIAWQAERARPFIRQPIATFVPLALVAFVHLLLSQPPGNEVVASIEATPLVWLLHKLLLVVLAPGVAISRYSSFSGIVGGLLAAAVYIGLRSGTLGPAPRAWRLLLAVGISMALLPPAVFGSSLADVRLLLAIVMLLWCALDLRRNQFEPYIGLAVAVVVFAVTSATAVEWRIRDAAYREARIALTQVAEGARIATVVLEGGGTWLSPHVGAWAVVDRSALLSNLFSRPFQPVLLSYRPEAATLAAAARAERVYREAPPEYRSLEADFDYVLVVGSSDARARYPNGGHVLFQSDSLLLLATGRIPISSQPCVVNSRAGAPRP